MNNTSTQILRFLGLLLLQVTICNNINFLGYINPYVYVLFVLVFPINVNRQLFLFLSFLLGLCVDIFSDSGGVHAAATVALAYFRPPVLKFSFGAMYDYQTIKFSNTEIGSRIGYFTLLVVLHHLILFSLEVFKFSEILLVLKKTLFSSLFTIFICLLFTVLFSKKTK
ncbi:MAG: rod shape-determining protein MreD [Bacteroidetes bacterium MedPE-SWsnd-G2]|nr:MAG: rod shape-determining protein MreD [Bacteroidetes bacterium MedPE-SWsnd-G2]